MRSRLSEILTGVIIALAMILASWERKYIP